MLSFQVYTYINVLYTYVLDLNGDTHFTLYNGAAESLNTLIGRYNYRLQLPTEYKNVVRRYIDVLYYITVYRQYGKYLPAFLRISTTMDLFELQVKRNLLVSN